MKKFAIFVIFTLYFILFTLPVNASYISLQTTLTSRYENGRLTVKVSIINKGDEPAHNVQAEFRVGGQSVLSRKIAALPVGRMGRIEQNLPFKAARPGTYPLALVTHYTDANQYDFSALSLQTFVYRDAGYAPLAGQLSSASFDREGRLDYKLKNSGQGAIKAQATLVAPVELTVAAADQELAIGPGAEQSLSFTVKNFSALAGSSYQVFAVTEFEDGGLHYTAIAPGLVKIVARSGFLGVDTWGYFAVLAVLVLAFAAAQLLRKK